MEGYIPDTQNLANAEKTERLYTCKLNRLVYVILHLTKQRP